jgi:general secretion pathway protein G
MKTAPRSGFTYIELMVAIAIMGVLALSVVPLSDWLRQRSQESQLRDALRQIRTAIDAYRKAAEDGSITRPQGASPYPRSLAELARGVPAAANDAVAQTSAREGGARVPGNLPAAGVEAPSRGEEADARTPTARSVYFLRRIPRDPFFPDPRVPAELTWGLRSSDSPPDRPAPGKDVFDVYSLSPRRAIDGSYYRTW